MLRLLFISVVFGCLRTYFRNLGLLTHLLLQSACSAGLLLQSVYSTYLLLQLSALCICKRRVFILPLLSTF